MKEPDPGRAELEPGAWGGVGGLPAAAFGLFSVSGGPLAAPGALLG